MAHMTGRFPQRLSELMLHSAYQRQPIFRVALIMDWYIIHVRIPIDLIPEKEQALRPWNPIQRIFGQLFSGIGRVICLSVRQALSS